MSLDNPNPQLKKVSRRKTGSGLKDRLFDTIRDIRDPEHPHSLEELSVIDRDSISIKAPPNDSPGYGKIQVVFTPTVPHCSLASIIGLCIQLKIKESGLLKRGEHYYKLKVTCEEGSHVSAGDINKQLGDKERVSAAFENPRIMGMLRECTDNVA